LIALMASDGPIGGTTATVMSFSAVDAEFVSDVFGKQGSP